MTPDDHAPPTLTLIRLFLKFLRFGCLAFGGPIAQIGMIRHALVEEDRWISSERFNRLLAVMQALPGPEAHELCVHMGMIARGRIGGILAGLGFMLPGLLLMLLAGWLYAAWIALPFTPGIMLGVQVVVLAIILRAVHRIGRHVLDSPLPWILAAGSLAGTLAAVPFWIPLVAAGLVSAFADRKLATGAVLIAAVALALFLRDHAGAPLELAETAVSSPGIAALFLAGLKGGLLTFGGAYTAIPYVRADTVGRGWLSDGSFLDGVALANTLPAPLVIFATFAGYLAGGLEGALAITAGMFLPAFAFSLVFFERLEAVVENTALHAFLAGVAAAVIGVILATWLQLTWSTWEQSTNPLAGICLFAIALVAAWYIRSRMATPLLILAGGIAGAAVAL